VWLLADGDLRKCRVDDRRNAGWTAGAGYGPHALAFAIGAGNIQVTPLFWRIVLDSSVKFLSLINRECLGFRETADDNGRGETAMTMPADADLPHRPIEVA